MYLNTGMIASMSLSVHMCAQPKSGDWFPEISGYIQITKIPAGTHMEDMLRKAYRFPLSWGYAFTLGIKKAMLAE